MVKKIEISHRTIIFTVLFSISLYLLYEIRQILTIFFIAVVLMSAINPAVNRLEKVKIPRVLGIMIIYLLILSMVGLVVAGVIPPLVEQTGVLISRLPDYSRALGLPTLDHGFLTSQIDRLGSLSANIVKLTVGFFNNLISFFILLVVTFYLLIERKNLDRYLHFLFGTDGEEKAQKFVDALEKKLGGWVRAQLALMVIIGLMSYIGLRILGIDFALPLALLAGLLEVVPSIGPTLSAIPAVLAGLAISPLTALAVAALYFLIQQVENSLIVPQVMSRGVGVNPLVALLSLIIGFRLAGVVGAILAIPVVLLIQVVISEVFTSKRFQRS
jgi:predicted PurR-regulated permease PerM